MKLLFSILFLVAIQTSTLYSRDTTAAVLNLDRLPSKGVLLDKSWKFYAADDPDFADPEYDDRAWESIDPTIDLTKLTPATRSGIAWLRIRILTSDEMNKKSVAFTIIQSVASEMFLNGKLIYRFGEINNNPDKIIGFNPNGKPFAMVFEKSKYQVIAVRFAVQPKIKYSDLGTIPLLKMRIYSVNDAFQLVRNNERYIPINNTFRVGAFFILAVLHLAFFIYNPKQKAYLFFFMYAIFAIPGDILQFNLPFEIKEQARLTMLYFSFWNISGLFLLTALYILLNQRLGWIYWGLVFAIFLGLFVGNWIYSNFFISNLVSIELVRTALKAFKQKTKGSWIIVLGAMSFLIFMGAFIVGVQFELGYWWWPLGDS